MSASPKSTHKFYHLVCFQVSQTVFYGESVFNVINFFSEDNSMCTPTARDSYERLSFAGQALPPGFPSPFLFPDGLSSIETLLTNIQVLSTDRVLPP